MTKERIDQLNRLVKENTLDALAINPSPSLVYFTGLHFHLMERPTVLLIMPGKSPALILPALEKVKLQALDNEIMPFFFEDDPTSWGDAFRSAGKFLKLDECTIGVESTHLRYLEMHYLEMCAKEIRFVEADEVINRQRLQKDTEEIDAMRKAVKIAEAALEATLPFIREGKSEREIASELTLQLLRQGSDSELPFSPIVASGPNSANPHAVPTDRRLQKGDLLVIDWGATYDGYISDLTRTFGIGEVDTEYQSIVEIVRKANEEGRKAARPEISAGVVDGATRAVINSAGYGDYFTHRTGHGIGLESHEAPYIFGTNTQILKPGMTFTVEPGIYLAGHNGVRIEDNIVITPTGCETLSSLPRDLVIIK